MDCGAGEPIRRCRSGIWTSSPWQRKYVFKSPFLFVYIFKGYILCDLLFHFLIIYVTSWEYEELVLFRRFKLCPNLPQAFSSLWIYFLSQGAVMSALFSSCYFPWMITNGLNPTSNYGHIIKVQVGVKSVTRVVRATELCQATDTHNWKVEPEINSQWLNY